MIVTVDVAFPKKELTAEQKKLVSELLQQKDIKPDFYNGIKFPKKKWLQKLGNVHWKWWFFCILCLVPPRASAWKFFFVEYLPSQIYLFLNRDPIKFHYILNISSLIIRRIRITQ